MCLLLRVREKYVKAVLCYGTIKTSMRFYCSLKPFFVLFGFMLRFSGIINLFDKFGIYVQTDQIVHTIFLHFLVIVFNNIMVASCVFLFGCLW